MHNVLRKKSSHTEVGDVNMTSLPMESRWFTKPVVHRQRLIKFKSVASPRYKISKGSLQRRPAHVGLQGRLRYGKNAGRCPRHC